MPTTVTKPPILDETGQDILTQLRRIADAKESNLMGYGGAVMFADLPTPTSTNLGLFYLIKDAFTTDARFVEGAGVSESAGKYWAVINIGTTASPICKYDELGTLIDVSSKQDKDLATPLTIGGINQTTVEGALGGLNTAKVDISQGAANEGKILIVNSSGNLVLDSAPSEDIVGSNTFSANDTVCAVSMTLEPSDTYTLFYFTTNNDVTVKDELTTYSSGVLTVTFRKKPTTSGTMYIVARKVG